MEKRQLEKESDFSSPTFMFLSHWGLHFFPVWDRSIKLQWEEPILWWSQRAEMLAWGAEREKRMNKSDRKKILCQWGGGMACWEQKGWAISHLSMTFHFWIQQQKNPKNLQKQTQILHHPYSSLKKFMSWKHPLEKCKLIAEIPSSGRVMPSPGTSLCHHWTIIRETPPCASLSTHTNSLFLVVQIFAF